MSNKDTLFYREKQAVSFDFSAENISSDGGILLCNEIERKEGLLSDFSHQIKDKRDSNLVDYQINDMVKQRVFMMMLGYQDCNDVDKIKQDNIFNYLLGGKIASQPTLSRFENNIDKRTIFDLCSWFVNRYISTIEKTRKQIIIDIDATDDPTHGAQQLSLFNGFYNQTMYSELIINDGETGQMILPILRPGNAHSNWWAVAILKRIIQKIRLEFPSIKIIIRADSGFSSPKLYELVRKQQLFFACGIASNNVLKTKIEKAEKSVRLHYLPNNEKHQHLMGPFDYKAGTWEQSEKCYAKIESTGKGLNTRFFISNIEDQSAREIYFDFYVKRGDMSENRIKELKNMCYSGRLSCKSFWANFFRLLLSALCYEMFHLIKERIKKTKHKEAKKWQIDNIRLYLLKIGTTIKNTVRRVTIKFSNAFVYQKLLTEVLRL